MKRAFLLGIQVGDTEKIPINLYMPKTPRGKFKARHIKCARRFKRRVNEKIEQFNASSSQNQN